MTIEKTYTIPDLAEFSGQELLALYDAAQAATDALTGISKRPPLDHSKAGFFLEEFDDDVFRDLRSRIVDECKTRQPADHREAGYILGVLLKDCAVSVSDGARTELPELIDRVGHYEQIVRERQRRIADKTVRLNSRAKPKED